MLIIRKSVYCPHACFIWFPRSTLLILVTTLDGETLWSTRAVFSLRYEIKFLYYLNSHSAFRVKDDYDDYDYILQFFIMFKHTSLGVNISTMYPSLQMQFLNVIWIYISHTFHRVLFVRGAGFGRVSVVCIASSYGLGGPGIESRWGQVFPQPSRRWGRKNVAAFLW